MAAYLVAPALLVAGYDVAGLLVDQLLCEAVACLPVDLPKSDPFGRRRGRVQGNGAGDKRELEIALRAGDQLMEAARPHEAILILPSIDSSLDTPTSLTSVSFAFGPPACVKSST